MPRFARVVPESDLIQIDREFDFRIPAQLEPNIARGQRVTFNLGRSKKALSGFVIEILEDSPYATSDLISIVSETSVLTKDVLEFARKIADRQVVALGEILTNAIPEHMPRIEVKNQLDVGEKIPDVTFPNLTLSGELSKRSVVLCSPRNVNLGLEYFPEWALLPLQTAWKKLKLGQSSILIFPEKDDVKLVIKLAQQLGIDSWILDYTASKKSDRFVNFHKALSQQAGIVIGTRSVIYAPVRNLGLIALADDLDESLRDEGSPFTNARDLCLVRAGESVDLLFLANYRSIEMQRLVDLRYLTSIESLAAPIRFSFSEPGQRIDGASFTLLREQLELGPMLVLVPRKGHSLSAFCKSCREKVRCKACAGAVWQASRGIFECRLCGARAVGCHNCPSSSFDLGRAGSERTVAELGKAFPNTLITEVTAEKPIGRLRSKNHIVVATPGSIPAGLNNFAGLLILDSDIWLARETLRSEELAIRDWTDALALLNPSGRAVAAGMPAEIGKVLALGKHIAWAKETLDELRGLQLPPTLRTVTFEGAPEIVEEAVSLLLEIGAVTIRFHQDQGSAKALMKFPYKIGPQVSSNLRQIAIKAAPRVTKSGNRRGLRVVIDDHGAL